MLCTYHNRLHHPPQSLARKQPFSRPQVERRPRALTEISLFLNFHTPIQQYHCGLNPGNIQRGRSIQRRFQDYLLSLHVSWRGAVLYSGVSSSCIDTPLKHWVVQNQENNLTSRSGRQRGREAESHILGILQMCPAHQDLCLVSLHNTNSCMQVACTMLSISMPVFYTETT